MIKFCKFGESRASEAKKIDFLYSIFINFESKSTILSKILRVLLDKPPDIVTPTVGGKFLFGYIINSTYPGGLPKVKSLDLGAFTVLWGLDQVI